MNDREKVEEAHGLWKVALVRLAAFVEAGAPEKKIAEALAEERCAFVRWQTVSNLATKMFRPLAGD